MCEVNLNGWTTTTTTATATATSTSTSTSTCPPPRVMLEAAATATAAVATVDMMAAVAPTNSDVDLQPLKRDREQQRQQLDRSLRAYMSSRNCSGNIRSTNSMSSGSSGWAGKVTIIKRARNRKQPLRGVSGRLSSSSAPTDELDGLERKQLISMEHDRTTGQRAIEKTQYTNQTSSSAAASLEDNQNNKHNHNTKIEDNHSIGEEGEEEEEEKGDEMVIANLRRQDIDGNQTVSLINSTDLNQIYHWQPKVAIKKRGPGRPRKVSLMTGTEVASNFATTTSSSNTSNHNPTDNKNDNTNLAQIYETAIHQFHNNGRHHHCQEPMNLTRAIESVVVNEERLRRLTSQINHLHNQQAIRETVASTAATTTTSAIDQPEPSRQTANTNSGNTNSNNQACSGKGGGQSAHEQLAALASAAAMAVAAHASHQTHFGTVGSMTPQVSATTTCYPTGSNQLNLFSSSCEQVSAMNQFANLHRLSVVASAQQQHQQLIQQQQNHHLHHQFTNLYQSSHQLTSLVGDKGKSQSSREQKKCRKVYGMDHRLRWCKQCRWKKACSRFCDSSTPTSIRHHHVPSVATSTTDSRRHQHQHQHQHHFHHYASR